ncbi:MAG: polyphosphate kinase, partial [Chloroflexota bacterium]|nr:polyphosphate kinase [Chloroflexota bacterium]
MNASAGASGTVSGSAKRRSDGSATRGGRGRSRAARAKRSDPSAGQPYINRELSWLDYAGRVLFEAADARNPILERVNFLTIFAGMLDEFFQIRISGLRQLVHAGRATTSPDGRTAAEQL